MPDYTSQMRRMSNEDLVAIIDPFTEDEFEPEAIEAARAELSHRNVDPLALLEIQQDQDALAVNEVAKASEPLGRAGWLAFAVTAPFFVVTAMMAFSFSDAGYTKKTGDAFVGILVGVCFYTLVIAVLVVFGVI
ncbi:MAG: hypothetical protein AAF697_05875 [Pseudomonadota bacterium]